MISVIEQCMWEWEPENESDKDVFIKEGYTSAGKWRASSFHCKLFFFSQTKYTSGDPGYERKRNKDEK